MIFVSSFLKGTACSRQDRKELKNAFLSHVRTILTRYMAQIRGNEPPDQRARDVQKKNRRRNRKRTVRSNVQCAFTSLTYFNSPRRRSRTEEREQLSTKTFGSTKNSWNDYK